MRETRYKLNALRGGAFFKELHFSPDNAPNIKFSATAEIKRSFSGEIVPDADFDMLRDELQPMIFSDGAWNSLGIFRPTTPKLSGSATGERLRIDAYDRSWLLQTSRIETRLHLAAGLNYITAIEQQLTASGIGLVIKTPTSSTLSCDREDWEPGTSRLTIVNSLLQEIGYRDIWFDGDGMAHLEPYAAPTAARISRRYSSRDVLRAPIAPDYQSESDIFSAPNVFVVVCANADNTETLVATAVNDSPISSKSTFRRGMRICQQVKVNQIADQTALQAYADRLVSESQLSTQTITFSTLPEPGHGSGDVIAIDHPTIGGVYEETAWSLTMRSGELMSHSAKRTVLKMDEILAAAAPEEQAEQEEILIATVGAVTENGVTLIFAGEESASEKEYQGNVSAALKAGDRVKITKDSGTYLIDYAVGVPGSAIEEDTPELPEGGTTGQALVKKSSAARDVEWKTISLTGGLPTGGTDGQFLAKKGTANYSGEWVDNPIPTGGSDGQVLMKDGTTARKLKFGAPSAGQLVNGAHKVTLSTTGVLAGGSSKDISLGSSGYPFKDVYADGTIALAQSYSGSVLKLGGSSATIGFFGVTPVRRPTVSASATVAQVITALKSLGLFQ